MYLKMPDAEEWNAPQGLITLALYLKACIFPILRLQSPMFAKKKGLTYFHFTDFTLFIC